MAKSKQKDDMNKSKKTLYGDTIVEAVVAIAIYSIVAVLALTSMSSGLSAAQRNLESSMSRAAIDSQSDTLRYFYESYVAVKAGKADKAHYEDIWNRIKPNGKNNPEPTDLGTLSDASCEALIEADKIAVENDRNHATDKLSIFALSGRGALGTVRASGLTYYGFGSASMDESTYLARQVVEPTEIIAAPLYPRITYKNIDSSETLSDENYATDILTSEGSGGVRQSRVVKNSEGVWVFPRKTEMSYDFYVRTCWNPVGSKMPSTFTSVVRLYDAKI